jgi:hypothetical protein
MAVERMGKKLALFPRRSPRAFGIFGQYGSGFAAGRKKPYGKPHVTE